MTGQVLDERLDEISGMEASTTLSGAMYVHNDDGEPLIHVIDSDGTDRGSVRIEEAVNRDWEDLALIHGPGGPLLVIADTGDNLAQHASVQLYFIPEPVPDAEGRFSGSVTPMHVLNLEYPGGARDCESVAWDPVSDRLLLISKRDKPARLYALSREQALSSSHVVLKQTATLARFRPPTARDRVRFGPYDAPWVSQPTGMDIRDDGRQAAIISYRSLYLFDRAEGESWEQALARQPLEFEGPPSRKEEAVSYVAGSHDVMITTEVVPAPVYRFRLIEGQSVAGDQVPEG
ncbi:MAG: hypothetical protein R3348_07720 [Xanthomonadales bacterium]|nr:hypothetical protein [Xanthomonadales bacterium]